MLDFALGAKSGSVLANDSSVQFATFLVADLVSSGTDLVGPNSETEFPAFVNKLVKKLLLVAVKSNEAREKIVGVVGNSVVEFVELVGAFGCDKKTISIAHAVFGAVTDSPAQLHRQLTARLLPAASSTIAKLVSVESSPTLTSTPSLQETSARISELAALVFHNISGFFLKDSDLIRLKSQAAWDSILDTTVSVSSGIPQAQLEAYLKASLESFAHLSGFFTSDYDVVAPILPSLLKSVALSSILSGNSRLVFSKVKEFLDVVAAEHLEYDAPRTEISVVALEALSLLAFNVSELAGEAIEFLTKFILSPKLCVGNSHVHITVVRNCAIAMLKKSLVLLDDAAVTKSTLYIFVNTLQSSSVQGGAFVHEACVSAIAGLIPAISTRQTVEVAVPAIVRKIEASNTDDAQTRAMWESLEIATLTGSIDVLEEAYPVLSSSIVKGDRLKFECSLATKVSLPLDVGNDKGLFNLSTVIKALCDIPGFHPEVHASEELILSFRNFWLVITAFVFAPRAAWPKEWIPIVTSIASKTPTLALGAKHRSLEIDLVANSVLRLKVTDQVYHKVKSCLVGSLYSRASETKSVSNAIATFLLSVFQIELFRVGKGSFSFFLDYIKDERYYETDVFPLLQAIGEEVLFAYTKGKSIGKSSIQSSFKALLRCGSHRLVKVKHFASTCSVRLLNAVPALLWDKTLVCYMLDVVLYLDSKRLVLDDRLAVLKGKLGFELHFVDEIEQAQAAKEYRALCANLLNLALGYSLSETTLTMQEDSIWDPPVLPLFESPPSQTSTCPPPP
ncbi:hypothetical protein BCR33DRAFT_742647 [Rhizoclosmatium globosum]|uniref:Uncharacterized protein n=1 Tax=Rhizoclosmatium globosum TaxID=329046 RepID=A0A1Y2BPL5_9FUNG|nr:hypothetical protein BCR33DRAFT_742647 [Rhizoclosmatium globosum]|eukprot:ORY36691.1 hypothetical protein BCR33DRAFT_742647 [Rhizoclosmatium globosum]